MGKLRNKVQKIRVTLKYYFSVLHKAKAHANLLDAVNEIQKFGDAGCFDNYPEINVHCGRFKEECVCAGKTCPVYNLNKEYIKAMKRVDDARIAHYQAETALFCTRVQ